MRSLLLILVLSRVTTNLVRQHGRDRRQRRFVHLESRLDA
jgi:hypothetical protein